MVETLAYPTTAIAVPIVLLIPNDYLSDPAYRRKISRQLNKGESLHALKRDLLYAHEGTIRARHLEQQTEQAWCLTLVTNAVVTWTTEYYGLAVESMRRSGRRIGPTSPRHTARTSTSSAPSTSTSKASWPSSAPPDTGRCGWQTPSSDPDSGVENHHRSAISARFFPGTTAAPYSCGWPIGWQAVPGSTTSSCTHAATVRGRPRRSAMH
ncbi:Tn3 family transposase [Arthrobacter oryzae]|uniref:Tn3 family transposase n=1 Tax=Arthrobacter oryzae TaxID=409290 RepID=UPI001C8282DF